MWPTPTERIMGRFSLINQHSVLFLAWLPYSPVCLNSDYLLPLPADADRAETNTARGALSPLSCQTESGTSNSQLMDHRSGTPLASWTRACPCLRFEASWNNASCRNQQLTHTVMLGGIPHVQCLKMSRADRARYALRPTPLSDVKALHKHTPAFGWQHIVIVPENGVNMPPLWFSTGGVRTLIDTLKQVSDRNFHLLEGR